MTIPRNLSKLAEGADSAGVLDATNGGTGLSAPGADGNILTSNGTVWVSATPSGISTSKAVAMAIVFGG